MSISPVFFMLYTTPSILETEKKNWKLNICMCMQDLVSQKMEAFFFSLLVFRRQLRRKVQRERVVVNVDEKSTSTGNAEL